MPKSTVQQCLVTASDHLSTHGISAPRLESEVLLASVLGCSRTHLHAYPEQLLSPLEQGRYNTLVQRRCAGEPLAYITGVREFCGLEFAVRPGVLIPRQETEHLVDRLVSSNPLRFADIGTGSGCIAISALKQLPMSSAVAVDISVEALAIAKENAVSHKVDDRLEFIQGDLCVPLQGELFDAIISNPPYVDWAHASSLRDEVSVWEPAEALFAHSAGLELYPRLVQQAEGILKPGGLLAFEVGIGQAADVANIISAGSYESPQVICDYSGIERVVWTRKTR